MTLRSNIANRGSRSLDRMTYAGTLFRHGAVVVYFPPSRDQAAYSLATSEMNFLVSSAFSA